ncbi:MAG: cysteine desulfurase family protein [Cyclobacteriaceae bacterium]
MFTEKSIYFDNAATTPLDERVIQEMLPFFRQNFGNPSSVHSHGRQVRAEIEKARKKVAQILNVQPGEIFFTSGGTEADNTAISGAIESYHIKHVITSPIEHHAVLHTVENCAEKFKIPYSLLKTDKLGNIDINQLEDHLKSNPNSLVSLMHGNNEIGNLIDLVAVSNLCHAYGAYFHSDTVQTIGHYHHDLKSMPNLHAIAGAAHKFHGPKGVGFLYVNKNKKIKGLIKGGSQERNMRGGTENVPGIIGLAKALEISVNEMGHHRNHILALKNHFTQMLSQFIPGAEFHGLSGEFDKSLYTVLNVSFPVSERNQGMLLFHLDLAGISVSGGSACSSGATLGSHVLRHIQADPNREAIRFSFSRFNTKEEIDYCIEKLHELYP